MSDPLEKLRTELHQESAESDARLREFIREGLTDDRLREDWDRLRGAHRLRSANAPGAQRDDAWKSLLSAVWLARLPQRLGPVAAVALVGFFLWFSINPAGSVMTVDPGERAGNAAGEPVLPRQLRVNFKKQTIEFFGDGDKLTGGLTELAGESTAEIAAFRVSAKGKDSTGLEGTFEGRALATRAVASGPVRSKNDLKKIVVQGDLRITGAGNFPVKSTYLP